MLGGKSMKENKDVNPLNARRIMAPSKWERGEWNRGRGRCGREPQSGGSVLFLDLCGSYLSV